MASVLNRDTMEFKSFCDTVASGYETPSGKWLSPVWIKNPDMSQVKDVPSKYWKIVSNRPMSMSQGEIKAHDDAHAPKARPVSKGYIINQILDAFKSDSNGLQRIKEGIQEAPFFLIFIDIETVNYTYARNELSMLVDKGIINKQDFDAIDKILPVQP